jgi:hypothetical protein
MTLNQIKIFVWNSIQKKKLVGISVSIKNKIKKNGKNSLNLNFIMNMKIKMTYKQILKIWKIKYKIKKINII